MAGKGSARIAEIGLLKMEICAGSGFLRLSLRLGLEKRQSVAASWLSTLGRLPQTGLRWSMDCLSWVTIKSQDPSLGQREIFTSIKLMLSKATKIKEVSLLSCYACMTNLDG